jgi:hypothetical protein
MAWGPDVRILTRHGSIAAGGEVDYIVRGKMIGGWLPEYGNPGVMTFVVDYSGTISGKTSESAQRGSPNA